MPLIGELAAAAGHDPDVDLRPESVTVRLRTADVQGLTSTDAKLASQISAAAAGCKPRPTGGLARGQKAVAMTGDMGHAYGGGFQFFSMWVVASTPR